MTRQPTHDDKRTRLVKAVQACRRKVEGLDDDEAWRDFLEATAGLRSLSNMNAPQMGRVLDALHARGAPRTASTASRYTNTQQMRMIRGLWLELADLGTVRDRSEAALNTFVKRQTGQDVGRLDARAAGQVIEALAAWRQRVLPG